MFTYTLTQAWAGAQVDVVLERLAPTAPTPPVVVLSNIASGAAYAPTNDYPLKQGSPDFAEYRVTLRATLPGGNTATGNPIRGTYSRGAYGEAES